MGVPFFPKKPLKTAVLFLAFNRLETTSVVFDCIRKAKPPRLYIAVDGPRTSVPGEFEKVMRVRKYLEDNIDWECDVKKLFREKNYGCKISVSSAISWFFEEEDQGIILEDDCVPSLSFFWFCEELLAKYKYDHTIHLISGDSRGPDSFGMNESYSFCKYPMIWGWASWSRVWRNYDPSISDWPYFKKKYVQNISSHKSTVKFWIKTFDALYNNEIDTWDYQLCFLLFKSQGKCIVPGKNLVSNIGFGVSATHTHDKNSIDSNRDRFELVFPLDHNVSHESESKINNYYDRIHFCLKPIHVRIFNKFILKIKSALIKNENSF